MTNPCQNPCFNTYVGARYVPIFAGEWDETRAYEPLTVVYTPEGNSFISTTFVPPGTQLDNTKYWCPSNVVNGQVKHLQDTVDCLIQQISDLQTQLDNFESSVNTSITNIQADITTIQQNIATIKTQLTDINSSISNLSSRIDALNTTIQSLQGEISTLNESISTINSTLETIQESITNINSQITTINETLTQHTNQITSINNTLTQHETLINNNTKASAPMNYLFIGDSIMQNANWTPVIAERFPSSQVHGIICPNGVTQGESLVDTWLAAPTMDTLSPLTVVIEIGNNETSSKTNTEQIVPTINSLTSKILAKFPRAHVMVWPYLVRSYQETPELLQSFQNSNAAVLYSLWSITFPQGGIPTAIQSANALCSTFAGDCEFFKYIELPEIDTTNAGNHFKLSASTLEFGQFRTMSLNCTITCSTPALPSFEISGWPNTRVPISLALAYITTETDTALELPIWFDILSGHITIRCTDLINTNTKIKSINFSNKSLLIPPTQFVDRFSSINFINRQRRIPL